MLIALTGTPGTGKTSATQKLKQYGISVISLNDLALSHNFIESLDADRGSAILDLDKINRFIKQKIDTRIKPTIIEGHASHWLTGPEWVIILRCHPVQLRKRLVTKHWNKKKINENVEAEALDIILCEATEIHHFEKIIEIDTTNKTSDGVAQIILTLIDNNFSTANEFSIGKIDWSEEILKKHD